MFLGGIQRVEEKQVTQSWYYCQEIREQAAGTKSQG